jgi:flagellar protein FliO/FliZ
MDVIPKTFSPGGRRFPHRRLSSLWKATTTAGLLLVSAPLFAQPKADPVIYPRGSAAADAPASAASGGSNASLILAGVLLAGAGGWWLWLKRRDGLRGPGGKTTRLNIAESRSLGSRQYLVVADYDGKKFLLGVCPGSIELLTPLDGEKTEQP